jgi:predicted dithiol-disulfide oxidoreductase (DUF899 family)
MPKTMEKPLHSVRFPGETPEYRSARDRLLKAELDLRKQVEEVIALRRRLPLGGPLKQDYVFDEDDGKPVPFSELFRPGKDSLLIYNFMFGPEMKHACPSCTSILDGLDGSALHVLDRINFAVVAKSPIERIRSFARERGWRNLRLLSSAHNSYNLDYHGETAEGDQLPALNVFVRRDGRIHHFYSTELLYIPWPRGEEPRHVDSIWPVWSLLDVTPEGRGTDWNPRLSYAAG